MKIALDSKNCCIMDEYRMEILIKLDYPHQYDAMLKKVLSPNQYRDSQKTDSTYQLSKIREAIFKEEIAKHNNRNK